MKKFFSIFLAIIFSLFLFITLILSITRSAVSSSAISDFARNALKPVSKIKNEKNYNNGLYYPGQAQLYLSDYEDFDFEDMDFSNLSDMNLNEIVESYLDMYDVDIEPDFIADILSAPETTQFVDKYIDEIISYAIGEKDSLEIDAADVSKVVNNAIDLYEKETGEVVDRSGLEEGIQEGIEEALPEISSTIDNIKEEDELVIFAIKLSKFFLSQKFFIICVSICVILALIIFLINLNIFTLFKYISIPAIVDGVLLFIPALFVTSFLPLAMDFIVNEFSIPVGLSEAVLAVAGSYFKAMKIEGAVCIILGVAICIFGFKLGKKSKTELIESQE
ncbi:MAG: hypothetical protein K5829_11590 [Treponema sp.]|nr:hypothetical protein [Treponema sp.]